MTFFALPRVGRRVYPIAVLDDARAHTLVYVMSSHVGMIVSAMLYHRYGRDIERGRGGYGVGATSD